MPIRTITIDKFHEQFFKEYSKGAVARKMQITGSAYSTILNGTISKNSKYFKTASEFIRAYGYYLIMDTPEYALQKKYEKQIRDLTIKLQEKDQEIISLKNEILWYNNTNPELKKLYLILKEKFEKCI